MMLEVILLSVAILCNVLPASAQNSLNRDLSFSLPFVIVLIIIIAIFVLVVYMLYRAKRGYFCCLRPVYTLPPSVRAQQDREEQLEQDEEAATNALPPGYQHGVQQRPLDIAPPDYRDALQDQILSDPMQSPSQTTPTGEFPPTNPTTTDSETAPQDDHTPATPPEPVEPAEVELVVPTDEPDRDLEDSAENCDDTTPLNP